MTLIIKPSLLFLDRRDVGKKRSYIIIKQRGILFSRLELGYVLTLYAAVFNKAIDLRQNIQRDITFT